MSADPLLFFTVIAIVVATVYLIATAPSSGED